MSEGPTIHVDMSEALLHYQWLRATNGEEAADEFREQALGDLQDQLANWDWKETPQATPEQPARRPAPQPADGIQQVMASVGSASRTLMRMLYLFLMAFVVGLIFFLLVG